MLTPGFMTDAVGLLLLIPPVRRFVAGRIAARVTERAGAGGVGPTIIFGGAAPFEPSEGDDEDPPPPGVIDV